MSKDQTLTTVSADQALARLREGNDRFVRSVRSEVSMGKAARTAPRVTLVTSLVLVPGALVLVISGLIVGSGVDFGVLLGG